MAKTKDEQAPVAQEAGRDQALEGLRAAVAAVDAACTAVPYRPEAYEQARAEFTSALQGVSWPEEPADERVLQQIRAAAASRNPIAARLMLEPRVKLRLYQAAKPAKPLPEAELQINGLYLQVPRGAYFHVPDSVAQLLEQAGIS